ncbi:hypothetical protein HDU97_000200 [Phlyctochytrium planicorne]|nr:hypothetical protein HDU97_000200 [Phlyctochytrium planicorne]
MTLPMKTVLLRRFACSHAIASQGVEADLIYVQKVQNSLAELNVVKETAIRAENYILADQTRQKMLALQLQLVKMEHQLNADIVVNAITSWQNSLAESIQTNLTNLSTYRKAAVNNNYPLKEKFHLNFLEIIKILPNNYYDSFIRSLLLVVPHDVPDVPKSPYGWDVFSRKINNLFKQPIEVIDVVKATVTVGILDALLRISKLLNTSNLKRDTHELFLRHAFFYIRSASTRRPGVDIENKLFEEVMVRWSIIIGDLAVVDRGTIMRQVASILDATKKVPSEEIITVLSATRYISILPRNDRDAQELAYLMHELINHYERNKKLVVRLSVIQALERLVQPLDFTNPSNDQPWEIGMHNELVELFKFSRKWASSEDLRPAALRLCIVIALNTNFDFFQQCMDIIINELFAKAKIKPYVYDCILQILRGRYYVDTKNNARERIVGDLSLAASYGFLTRPYAEEDYDAITERMKYFADNLFVKKKGPIPINYLDTCVDVLVQMAAHNLQVTFKLISYLLEPRGSDSSSTELYFIGLRALRIVLDPESGFKDSAANRHDPQFGPLLSSAAADFEAKILNIYSYCDQITNISAMGSAMNVYEPAPFSSKISGTASAMKLRRAHTTLNRTQTVPNGVRVNEQLFNATHNDDDILAMLSDAIDMASLKSPRSPSNADDLSARLAGTPPSAPSKAFDGPGDVTENARASIDIPRNSLDIVAEEGSIYNTGTTMAQKGSKEGGSISALAAHEAKVKESNDKVREAVTSWYRACGDTEKNVDKLRFSSALTDPNRANPKLNDKGDISVVLRLLKELLRIVPLIPCRDLVSGPLFIGMYLVHVMPDIATEASFSLQRLFQLFPEMRLRIMNAFVNLIKYTNVDNDIVYCTFLLHLNYLVQTWADEDESLFANRPNVFDRDLVQRVSCKIDACMFVMMARPNPRIRLSCLKILSNFYAITEGLAPHANGPGFLPLYAILVRTEAQVSKSAVYAFMERDLHGQSLVPKVTAGLTLLSIADVAGSDFGILFRFYLGEIARQFSASGRAKALRHCSKILRKLAIPLMTSVNTVDAAFVATYSSYCVLLMSLSAVPDKSEDPYSLESQIVPDRLLFSHFKDFLGPILNSDNDWEINAIIASTYFLHHGIVQLFIVQLWKWYTEMSENVQRLNPMMLDNVIHTLRVITQCPNFEAVIKEPPAFQSSTVDIISEFLRMIEGPLLDLAFIQVGPISRLKTSINYCFLVKRLSDSILSGRMTIMQEREEAAGLAAKNRMRPSMIFDADSTGLFWDNGARRSVFLILREWSMAIDAQASNQTPVVGNFAIDEEKIAGYRLRFSACIGLAAEALLSLGDMNEGVPLPAETLTWMANLEGRGFKVFSPQLLVNYENVLGTALAHSYGGKGVPHVFTNAIFEQILPRMTESPKQFLTGQENNLLGMEDHIATLHMLPTRVPGANEMLGGGLLHFPEVDDDVAEKLRQNVGSLIFFGLYNLLSSNKLIRIRSLMFVREIFTLFNPDTEIDIGAVFSKYTGTFYSNIGQNLKEKVLEMSRLAADLFPADAPSFLWEAVRCSRSVQKSEKSPLLIPSQQWILELIVPWCRYVNLANTEEDVVFAEFFRYLMDSAFYKAKHDEQVQICWTEVASSEEFGQLNTDVFCEVLVHICGKFEGLREQAVGLLNRVFGIYPQAVSEALAYHLSSSAFAWKSGNALNANRQSRPIVREYITVLYTALNGNPPESAGDYASSCKAAILLLSELLLHNYVAVAPHFPVLLNYILIHLPSRLQDNSLSTFLLANMVEGYTGTLHRTGNMENPDYASTIEKLRKLLAYLDTNICLVDWESDTATNSPDSQRYLRKPITDFLSLILSVFEKDYVSLSLDMARETVSWALDGLLGPDHSIRAIELYSLLVKFHPEMSTDLISTMTSRLLDHVSILSVMESDLIASSPTKSTKLLWTQPLDAKQIAIRTRCESVISSVLRLHSVLMSLFATSGSLLHHPELFWTSIGVLHLPSVAFSKIWVMALDNCRFFLSSQARDEIKANEYFLFEPYDTLQRRPPSLQPLLLQGLTNKDRAIQEKSFDFLLQSWLILPEYVVDASPPGLLYTILHTLVWIFVNILEDRDMLDRETISVDAISLHLQEILTMKSPLEFAGMIRCLQTIANGEPLPPLAVDDLLEKCTANIAQVYFPDYINNIADFCGVTLRLGTGYGRVVLKMTQVFWSLANHGQKPVGNFKSLVRRLPFVNENHEVINPLIGFVLRETADSDDFIKEIDLTSAGKVEPAISDDFWIGSSNDSLRAITDLGISSSSAIYKWR